MGFQSKESLSKPPIIVGFPPRSSMLALCNGTGKSAALNHLSSSTSYNSADFSEGVIFPSCLWHQKLHPPATRILTCKQLLQYLISASNLVLKNYKEICYSKSNFDLNFTFPFGIFTREQDGRSLGVGMSAFFVQSFLSNIHVCPFVVPPPTCSWYVSSSAARLRRLLLKS